MTIDTDPVDLFFDYFAYGSCMCPIDLQRSLGEPIEPYLVGNAELRGYRLGFYFYISHRNSGALDLVPAPDSIVHGVLYRLPLRLGQKLDEREVGYRHELISIDCLGQPYDRVRTYVAIDKLAAEQPPNEWYASIVMRGATNCNLPAHYRHKLHQHMLRLQGVKS
jgi:cation transport regulator ChaC